MTTMDLWAPVLKVWVSDRPGVGHVEVEDPPHSIHVGEPVTPQAAIDFALNGPHLTERALAFLALVVLDWNKQLDVPTAAGRPVPQRRRFAEHLGMTARGFSKFVERTLRPQSGRILRWDRKDVWQGLQPSRTGGPWWLATRRASVVPSIAMAKSFIKMMCDRSIDRGRDLYELLREALSARERGDWVEALGLLESLADRFRRRQWPRKDPLWFEVLLVLSGTQMQLGAPGLWPRVPKSIRTSISEQQLHGPEFDLIAARAHYVAALMYNQAGDRASARKTLDELRRCTELLDGRRDMEAMNELWKARSYQEITQARVAGVAVSHVSSAILEAGRVTENRRDQQRMRYGETLLYANRPGAGLDYIQSAMDSGRLDLPAQIILRRLEAMAKWMLGGKRDKALATLDEIQKEARSFGFEHQVRSVSAIKSQVRQGVRSILPH